MDGTKIIAITGACRGIGQATAGLLARHGHTAMPRARRSDLPAVLTADINAAGGRADSRVTNVTCRADLEALVARAFERFGRLDAIVNSAGIGPLSRFDARRVEDWDAMIDVNLRGTLYGITAALPVFAQQERGHVINVISTAGIIILPTLRAAQPGRRQPIESLLCYVRFVHFSLQSCRSDPGPRRPYGSRRLCTHVRRRKQFSSLSKTDIDGRKNQEFCINCADRLSAIFPLAPKHQFRQLRLVQ